LNHVEKEEGNGWVEISILDDGDDGKVLVRSDDVQHNKNYYDKDEMLEEMATEAIAKCNGPQ